MKFRWLKTSSIAPNFITFHRQTFHRYENLFEHMTLTVLPFVELKSAIISWHPLLKRHTDHYCRKDWQFSSWWEKSSPPLLEKLTRCTLHIVLHGEFGFYLLIQRFLAISLSIVIILRKRRQKKKRKKVIDWFVYNKKFDLLYEFLSHGKWWANFVAEMHTWCLKSFRAWKSSWKDK